jgi:hypothetical protein
MIWDDINVTDNTDTAADISNEEIDHMHALNFKTDGLGDLDTKSGELTRNYLRLSSSDRNDRYCLFRV